jgi:hypothetical protein
MTDDSATASLGTIPAIARPAGRFIVAAGKWMLNFEPEGSLAIHLPDGQVRALRAIAGQRRDTAPQ